MYYKFFIIYEYKSTLLHFFLTKSRKKVHVIYKIYPKNIRFLPKVSTIERKLKDSSMEFFQKSLES